MCNCVAFGARTISDTPAADGLVRPKYINSRSTLLYHKGSTFYGFGAARDQIAAQRSALIVEGFFGALRCREAGQTHVIATNGTSLTTMQASLVAQAITGGQAKVKGTAVSACAGKSLDPGVPVLGAAPNTPRRVKQAANTMTQSSEESTVSWSICMGGLSAPAALESRGTEATLARRPIFSLAKAMKRASSLPGGTESAARAEVGAGAEGTAGGGAAAGGAGLAGVGFCASLAIDCQRVSYLRQSRGANFPGAACMDCRRAIRWTRMGVRTSYSGSGLPLVSGANGRAAQADQEDQAHGHAGVAHGFGIAAEDVAS